MRKPKWDIRNQARAWGKDEAWERFILKPEKIEMVGGKLLKSDDERLLLLALLLENVGRIERPARRPGLAHGGGKAPR